MKLPETSCTQPALRLAFGAHHAPKPATRQVLAAVDDEAHALRISIQSRHHKLDYVAACIGKSRSYISRLQTGSAPIPDRLVMPLCAATGSLLLQQFRDMREAIDGVSEKREVERLAAMLREAA